MCEKKLEDGFEIVINDVGLKMDPDANFLMTFKLKTDDDDYSIMFDIPVNIEPHVQVKCK